MVRHGHAHTHLHRQKQKDWFDYSLYGIMVATPLFEVPQAWAIYSSHSAVNVSLTTWGFFSFANIAWIIYAMRHHYWPLIITSSLYMIIEVSIVVGILIYN